MQYSFYVSGARSLYYTFRFRVCFHYRFSRSSDRAGRSATQDGPTPHTRDTCPTRQGGTPPRRDRRARRRRARPIRMGCLPSPLAHGQHTHRRFRARRSHRSSLPARPVRCALALASMPRAHGARVRARKTHQNVAAIALRHRSTEHLSRPARLSQLSLISPSVLCTRHPHRCASRNTRACGSVILSIHPCGR